MYFVKLSCSRTSCPFVVKGTRTFNHRAAEEEKMREREKGDNVLCETFLFKNFVALCG